MKELLSWLTAPTRYNVSRFISNFGSEGGCFDCIIPATEHCVCSDCFQFM